MTDGNPQAAEFRERLQSFPNLFFQDCAKKATVARPVLLLFFVCFLVEGRRGCVCVCARARVRVSSYALTCVLLRVYKVSVWVVVFVKWCVCVHLCVCL